MNDTQTPRTKAKIKENLGLLMDFLRGKYGSADEEVERMLFNALDWTANDVSAQGGDFGANVRAVICKVERDRAKGARERAKRHDN